MTQLISEQKKLIFRLNDSFACVGKIVEDVDSDGFYVAELDNGSRRKLKIENILADSIIYGNSFCIPNNIFLGDIGIISNKNISQTSELSNYNSPIDYLNIM
ncbi:MAG: hypothetical protein LBI10_07415 [Deltaproteobacteria bacterium]|jgi:hypothetical protein|nr:hypothetical protein [Deltaproteobacteria bacterium]